MIQGAAISEPPTWRDTRRRVPKFGTDSAAPSNLLNGGLETAAPSTSVAALPTGLSLSKGFEAPKPRSLNNRSGLASDESIQGEAVKSGCVDTIVNDVKFFLHKYENGESHREN